MTLGEVVKFQILHASKLCLSWANVGLCCSGRLEVNREVEGRGRKNKIMFVFATAKRAHVPYTIASGGALGKITREVRGLLFFFPESDYTK